MSALPDDERIKRQLWADVFAAIIPHGPGNAQAFADAAADTYEKRYQPETYAARKAVQEAAAALEAGKEAQAASELAAMRDRATSETRERESAAIACTECQTMPQPDSTFGQRAASANGFIAMQTQGLMVRPCAIHKV